VTPFNHHDGSGAEYITQFHIRQGDCSASLAWDVRDARPREVLILRSTQGFVEDGVDPTGDDHQRLVYQGTDLYARLIDAGSTRDLSYRYSNDIAYYYSVFVRGDDGNWHLQLTKTAAPRSVSHWLGPGREGERRAVGGG
jgi:hypothetical protein